MPSSLFPNFVTNKTGVTVMRDFQHADRLYVKDNYARAPKLGFLYYVRFNINQSAISTENQSKQWAAFDMKNTLGLLAKKVDLPKFTVTTETLNQYNRKTIIQKGINYTPINIDLHDDNTDITHLLWVNYFKHLVVDGNQSKQAYTDTKYGNTDYNYGRYDVGTKSYGSNAASAVPVNYKFFESIDIFVLHQKNFTQYTLVNPRIKDWKHDSVEQASGNKILQNSMSIEYETVFYQQGEVKKDSNDQLNLTFYDKTPSPHTIGDDKIPEYRRGSTAFDDPLRTPRFGTFRPGVPDLLTQLGTTVLRNYINQNGLTRQKSAEYNIAGSALTAALGGGAGKYASPPSPTGPGVFNLGGVGIDIFKGFNTSVDGKISANPAALIFRKG